MKTRIDLADSVGKTIAGVSHGQYDVLVSFTDETFVVLTIDEDDDGDYIADGCGAILVLDRVEAVRIGIATDQEYAEAIAEDARVMAEDREKSERAVYERLKAKYGE